MRKERKPKIRLLRGTGRRLDEKDSKNTRRTVRNKNMRKIRWCTGVHRLEGKRGELELDAPLDCEPVEFVKCVDRRQV